MLVPSVRSELSSFHDSSKTGNTTKSELKEESGRKRVKVTGQKRKNSMECQRKRKQGKYGE